MAEKLTNQQRQAVFDRGGKLLVSAAAGSGKTKVLVDRLLSYIMDPVDPANLDDFLIITYTKAAAAELRGKIAAKLTERIAENPGNRHLMAQMQRLYLTKISTVHAFCTDLLREYAYRLDISVDYRVGDENECRELRQRAVEQLLEETYGNLDDPDIRIFIDTQGYGRNDAAIPELIQKVYDSARCHLDPDLWLDQCVADAVLEGITDAGQTIWGQYLLNDLFSYLDAQIEAMRRCTELLQAADGMEKPAALFADTLWQLQRLRESKTWDEVVKHKEIDYGRLTFPRKCADPELVEQVKAVRIGCKAGLEHRCRSFSDDSTQVLADLKDTAAATRGLVKLVRRFSDAYDQAKRSRRVLDFGDLEHKTLDLLLGKRRSNPTAVAREVSRRFREIMVDEYQDSNLVQDTIFGALTEERNNLFMVGDVKQSIYQFRLADPGIFLKKYAAFADAADAAAGEDRRVLLSSNFRSAGAVLSAVNDVFRTCMSPAVGGLEYGDAEALWVGKPHPSIGETEVEFSVLSVREQTYPEEADFVAQRICTLLDGTHMVRDGDGLRPIKAEDIVILLRSPGSVGACYQSALERRGIRCTSGGGTDLLQTEEIQALRSLLQIISNPRQDIPLIAALSSPVFCFRADDLAAIRANQRWGSFYDAVLAMDSAKCRYFSEILRQLRHISQTESLSRLLESIFGMTRMDSIYAAMSDGEVRSANLQAFFQMVSDFETSGRHDLSQLLEHLEALEVRGMPTSGEDGTGCVTIMSIHKSKGLEFPVVFLCGLSREFNRESSRAQVLCDKNLGLGLSCLDAKNRIRYPSIAKRAIAAKIVSESVSEELRVLYVAMTRACDRLIMTYASRNPEDEIRDMVLRSDLCGRMLMTSEVICPGEWVLYTALQRMEAGVLHNRGGRPGRLRISDHSWRITLDTAPEESAGGIAARAQREALPEGALETLRQALAYRYPHPAATATPSKQTATALKGRLKDQEAAEQAHQRRSTQRHWRGLDTKGVIRGQDYGIALHAVMQYIRYEDCGDHDSVEAEINRLVQEEYISAEQARIVDRDKIVRFFASDLGARLRSGRNTLREFKFSILDDASSYGEGLEGEKVLLQGVVDCALIDPDGITILDFKTDHVTEKTLESIVERYRPQVKAYERALGRIFETTVQGTYLYFFGLDQLIKV